MNSNIQSTHTVIPVAHGTVIEVIHSCDCLSHDDVLS